MYPKRGDEMRKIWIVAGLLTGITLSAASQVPSTQTAGEKAIRAVMNAQVVAWNAGDIDGFMKGYENSPQTTLIGHTVHHGYAEILAHFKKNYPGKEKMGTLTFTNLEVRMLSASNAVVTGNFQLDFPDTGAAEQQGIFSLVWARTPQGWKIILDHSS